MELSLLPYLTSEKLKKYKNFTQNKDFYRYILRQINLHNYYRLAPGIFVTDAYLDALTDPEDYALYIANIIHSPSYISLTTALYLHTIIQKKHKFIYSIALSKRRLKNKYGIYNYLAFPETQRMEMFRGYEPFTTTRTFDMATPAKALFDFLFLNEIQPKDFIETFDVFLQFSYEHFSKDMYDELAFYIDITANNGHLVQLLQKLKARL